jgi:hypothetical protein
MKVNYLIAPQIAMIARLTVTSTYESVNERLTDEGDGTTRKQRGKYHEI